MAADPAVTRHHRGQAGAPGRSRAYSRVDDL